MGVPPMLFFFWPEECMGETPMPVRLRVYPIREV